MQAAVEAVGTVERDEQIKLADWLRENEVDTILGPLSWDEQGSPRASSWSASGRTGCRRSCCRTRRPPREDHPGVAAEEPTGERRRLVGMPRRRPLRAVRDGVHPDPHPGPAGRRGLRPAGLGPDADLRRDEGDQHRPRRAGDPGGVPDLLAVDRDRPRSPAGDPDHDAGHVRPSAGCSTWPRWADPDRAGGGVGAADLRAGPGVRGPDGLDLGQHVALGAAALRQRVVRDRRDLPAAGPGVRRRAGGGGAGLRST